MKERYTAEELAALLKEIQADEAAAKREEAHWYGMEALKRHRKILDEKAKALGTEKANDKGIER
jgi:hypothetical protein